MDLAEGHSEALKRLNSRGYHAINLGAGQGVSVLEMVNTFMAVSGKEIDYESASRRAGDLPAFWADASKAQKELGWVAKKSLRDMMADTWRWQSRNPDGYLV